MALSLSVHSDRGYRSQANPIESMSSLWKPIDNRLSNAGGTSKAEYPLRSRLPEPSQRPRIDDSPMETRRITPLMGLRQARVGTTSVATGGLPTAYRRRLSTARRYKTAPLKEARLIRLKTHPERW